MIDEDLKSELEKAFQNGGPKVYLVSNGWLIPSFNSAKRTLEIAYAHEQVYARQKVRGERRYEWKLIGARE